MILSKLSSLARSCSNESVASADRRSCPIVDRREFLMRANLLKERSPCDTENGWKQKSLMLHMTGG